MNILTLQTRARLTCPFCRKETSYVKLHETIEEASTEEGVVEDTIEEVEDAQASEELNMKTGSLSHKKAGRSVRTQK